MNRKTSIIFLVCCVAIFAFHSFFGGGMRNDIDIGETSLSLSHNEFQTSINYEDIRSIELVEVGDFGTAAGGGANRACRWGTWTSERWGRYTQYTVTNTDHCVLITLVSGECVLISLEGKESTVTLGETLYEMLISSGYELEKLGCETA